MNSQTVESGCNLSQTVTILAGYYGFGTCILDNPHFQNTEETTDREPLKLQKRRSNTVGVFDISTKLKLNLRKELEKNQRYPSSVLVMT